MTVRLAVSKWREWTGEINFMKKILTLIFASLLVATAARADVSVSLVQAKLDADSTVAVNVLVANTGTEPTSFTFAAELEGKILSDGQTWPVKITRAQAETVTIAPGSFASKSYAALAPADAKGSLILEAEKGLPTSAAAMVQRQTAVAGGDAAAAAAGPVNSSPRTKTAASLIERTFADRISAHEPIYFIYGSHAPNAKFQFSFKYELAHLGTDTPTYVPDTVQFAYTQRSLWNIDGNSSPFYDTSYMPEMIFESLAPAPKKDDSSWFTYLGYQAAARHESNGKDGADSRSLNTAYLRPLVAIGPLDGWHVILAPEIFAYIGGLSDNRNLADYRGYGQVRAVLAKNSGPSLMFTGIPGRGFHTHTLQWDLTVPVHIPIIDWKTYLLFQYFDGYGESLLHYDQKSRVLRAGISLVR